MGKLLNERRKRVIEMVEELIKRKPYFKVTEVVEEISDKTGISPRTVYRYIKLHTGSH